MTYFGWTRETEKALSERADALGLRVANVLSPILINPHDDAIEVRLRIPVYAIARAVGEEQQLPHAELLALFLQRIDAAALELVPKLRALADDIERKVRGE